MPHPDPEVQRHIERLMDYANGLLDAGTAPSQVISLVMAKGLDYETAAKFVNALLAVRAERTGCNGRQDKPPDYYEVLQVSPNADLDVIQAAYKRLALKYHPDRNRDPEAEQKMRLLNDAYATLSDPDRRRAYDAARKQHTAGYGPQAASAQQPSSETQRQIQELSQYVNLLLDRAELSAAVVQCIMAKGLDDEIIRLVRYWNQDVVQDIMAKGLDGQLAGDVLRTVLANRLTMAFPASGGCPDQPTPEQKKQVTQLVQYVILLLDSGESVQAVTQKLLAMGLDKELADKLINPVLAERGQPVWKGVLQEVVGGSVIGLMGIVGFSMLGALLFAVGALILGKTAVGALILGKAGGKAVGALILGKPLLFWTLLGGVITGTLVACVWVSNAWKEGEGIVPLRERLLLTIVGGAWGFTFLAVLVWFLPSGLSGFENLQLFGIFVLCVLYLSFLVGVSER